jgi:hypothetical protein
VGEQRRGSLSTGHCADKQQAVLVGRHHPALAGGTRFEGDRGMMTMTSLASPRHRHELTNVLPRSLDAERRTRKRKRTSNYTETTMHDRPSEPVKSGNSVPVPQHWTGTRQKEERRQAGTPATLEGNIDNTIDKNQDNGGRPGAQAYPAQWLRAHAISGDLAEIIATEFGWGKP